MEFVYIKTTRSKRALQRVEQHGRTMILRREENFKGKPAILVESRNKTFRCNGKPMKWNGWFTSDDIDLAEALKSRPHGHLPMYQRSY